MRRPTSSQTDSSSMEPDEEGLDVDVGESLDEEAVSRDVDADEDELAVDVPGDIPVLSCWPASDLPSRENTSPDKKSPNVRSCFTGREFAASHARCRGGSISAVTQNDAVASSVCAAPASTTFAARFFLLGHRRASWPRSLHRKQRLSDGATRGCGQSCGVCPFSAQLGQVMSCTPRGGPWSRRGNRCS